MGTLYIIGAIEYLMYAVKSPWWVMVGFGALMLAHIVNCAVNAILADKEKQDEKGNV